MVIARFELLSMLSGSGWLIERRRQRQLCEMGTDYDRQHETYRLRLEDSDASHATNKTL